MSFYGNLSGTAYRLLREKGKACTVSLVITPGAYSPASSSKEPDVVLAVETGGLLTAYTARQIDNKTILATDRKLLLPAQGLSRMPKAGDRVSFGSDVYAVVEASAVEPGPVPLLYNVQLRK